MPASAAPERGPPRHLKTKKNSPQNVRNGAHPAALGHKQAVEESNAVTRPRSSQKLRTRTSPSALSTGPSLQDAVRPQLSERDSIFATHYMPSSSPVTSPQVYAEREATVEGEGLDSDTADMAVSGSQRTLSDRSLTCLKDVPTSAHSGQTQTILKGSSRRKASRSSLPLQYQRRSLINLSDLHHSSHLRDTRYEDLSTGSDSAISGVPTTPKENQQSPVAEEEEEVILSAEREQYRSWRQGKAKLNGMSIADSQRRKSRVEHGVDKIIDAQLPKPEPAVTNVRSRKASHYLGLFKENEAQERQHDEKKKGDKKREPMPSGLGTLKESVADNIVEPPQPTAQEDVEATEAGNDVTMTAKRMAHNLPLDLLEEIRNHHHLAPGAAWETKYRQTVPAKDQATRRHRDQHLKAEQQDEESDHEHISSATYFPHQGVAVSDSPTDDKMVQREAQTKRPTVEPKQSDDVDIALRSTDAQDYLRGDMSLSRAPSTADFELL
ncbi:inositol polyphosphate kinase kcs1, partial [Vermiconidia calcicola]